MARARALALVGFLVVAALVVVLVAVVKDKQSTARYASGSCPAEAIKIRTRPLPKPEEIKLNIFNGTGTPGLAVAVADGLRNRGFTVGTVGDAAHYDGVAKLSYGPQEVAAATVVRAQFVADVDTGGFDKTRTNDVVDVTIGTNFTQLGTKTAVNEALSVMGNPSPPPGTCDIG
jgi:hypothetical protein